MIHTTKDLIGAIPQSDYNDALFLTASVAKTATAPKWARRVIFEATDEFWVKIAGTAAIPAADVTDGSASILNPVVRNLNGGEKISVIAPRDNCIVCLQYYATVGE